MYFSQMAWSGKLFTPRGVSGLGKQIQAEIRTLSKEWLLELENHTITNISDLRLLSKLRIPQSVWVPLVDASVTSMAEFESSIAKIDWGELPKLKSHGARVSLSRDSILSRSVSEPALRGMFKDLSQIDTTEVSVRIDSLNRMSVQMNGIPPRLWVPTPVELEATADDPNNPHLQPWWSVRQHQHGEDKSSKLSEDAIKRFRDESSLCCMTASLLRSAGLGARLDLKEPLVIWDPFMTSSGTVLLECLNHIVSSGGCTGEIAFVGSVSTQAALEEVLSRLYRFVDAHGLILETEGTSTPPMENTTLVSGRGRKSSSASNRNQALSLKPLPSRTDPALFSCTIQFPNRLVELHVTTRPFQEVLPHMRGALVLSHIPKTYSEQLGLGKRQLTEWGAFGDFVRTRDKTRFEMHFLCETGAFLKYSKLKFAKTLHMVSPGGHVAASVSKWLGH